MGCLLVIRMILQWVFPSPSPPSRLANLPPSPHPEEAVERPSSPTSYANELQDFDIFLSFRGEDTRNGFTGHLYDALRRRSLKTFIDNIELHKGESIHKLLTYIERSKVFVPIISKGYADSKWCLKEIAKIVECEGGRLIVPIFLDVDPSHVRHQDGPFQSAFKSYDKDKKVDKAEVDKWRDALKKVANISGYSLQADANGHEATLVDKVVHRLLQHLDSGLLFVADHPVGMESRFDDMNNLLQIERDGVKMVGLVGTGGIGKTTIAMYVFNKLRSNFGAATFVNNIREYWKNDSGKTQLMRQLVKDILDDKVTSIDNIQRGQQLLLQRLPPKKFLIVLDDVDHQQQFNQLIGERLLKRFASGTRIIMTTRDESVLSLCRVDGIYKPKLMDADQSLDLFKRYAFQSSHQPEDMFVDMSMKVVAVAGGLPLALIVFGSYLSDKSDLAKWQDYLDQLKKTSKKGIHDSLKISYDGLSDFEKWIFLDIACFFVGHSQVEATVMWESLNWLPRSSIEVLQQKSLITRVREDEPFDMHDLIRDMGRDIVRHGKPYPSEWSRVWTANDTLNMLGENRRNKVIEGINLSGPGEKLSSEAFGKMTKLRVLRVNSVEFKGENFMLPKSLKVLFFTGSNIKSHSSCNLDNLVTLEIDVANSMSEFLVRESASKVFNALKFLKISSHHSIRLMPDFSNMPHLERLEFSNCYFLVEIPQSIGKLRQLKYLKFFEFLNVEKLPDAICQLTSLQTLRIKRFPRLQSLPERLGNLKSLNTLELDELAITSTPSSIGQLTKLKEMYLTNLDRLQSLPDSISSLNSLQVFNVEGTDLKGMKIDGVDLMNIVRLEISSCNCLSVLPDSSLKKARALRITDSTIKELPESIKAMEKIEQLSLRCKNLMALPDWLPNLKTLEVDCEFLTSIINKIFSLRSMESLSLCCANLEELPAATVESFVESLKSFTLRCKNLRALPAWIGSLANLEFLKLEACENITELPLSMCNLSQLKELALNGCKRIRSVPPLPSSLLVLDGSNCSDLEKTLDISNLKVLKKLRLGGCRLLEDVQGIEDTAQNMEELVMPGPYDSIGCSCLSDDFKKKVFKELAFKRLLRFEICGSLAPGSTTGHQQLYFMFPNRADGIKPELMMKRLVLNKVRSPIHVQLLEDDHHVVFESTLEVQPPIVKNFFRPIWIPLPRALCRVRYRGQYFDDGLGLIGVPCHKSCAESSMFALGRSEVLEVEEVAAEDGHEDGGGLENETEAEEEADKEPEVFIVDPEEVVEDGRENGSGRDSTETGAGNLEVQWVGEVLNEVEEEEEKDGLEEGGGHECETEAEEVEWEAEVPDEVEEVAEDGRENGGGRDRKIEDEHRGGGNEIRAYGPKIIHVFQPNRVPHFIWNLPRFIHWRHQRSVVSSDYEVNFGKEDQIQERLRTHSHATILVLADASNLTTVGMTFSFTGEG